MKIRLKVLTLGFLLFPLAHTALAHEAYVLPEEEFQRGITTKGPNIFLALKNPVNLKIFGAISILVFLGLVGAVFIQRRFGKKISAFFERGQRYAQPILRLTFGAALIAGALSNSFLGPEIYLPSLGGAPLIRLGLILAGSLIILGFMSEIGAGIVLCVFVAAIAGKSWYMANYVSYLAETIALIIFGAGAFGMDHWLNISRLRFARFKSYEALIIRLGYGAALIFSAVSVKFLHPSLTLSVINEYHLTDFHLLFPSDPMLALLGAALAELAIGLFVLLGFQTRLVVAVSLFYITLSLLFFEEAIWPHFILYGLAIYLLLAPQKKALDNILDG